MEWTLITCAEDNVVHQLGYIFSIGNCYRNATLKKLNSNSKRIPFSQQLGIMYVEQRYFLVKNDNETNIFGNKVGTK